MNARIVFVVVLVLVLLFGDVRSASSERFVEEPDDVETIVGSTILFRCRTHSMNENEINWCKNDFCTMGKSRDLPFYPRYEIIGQAQRGEHHFKIVNVSREDSGVYQCQILARSNRSASLSRKAKLNILEKPTNLRLTGASEIVENVASSLLCRCENGQPQVKFVWSVPPSLSILSENEFVLIHNEFRRETISNLTVRTNRSASGASIRCSIQSKVFALLNETMQIERHIAVRYSPTIEMKIFGQEIENETIRIRCDVDSHPPWNEIRWFDEDNRLFTTPSNRTEIDVQLTRSSHSKRIRCRAKNSIGMEEKSLPLNVTYRPAFVDESGSLSSRNWSLKEFVENVSVELRCLFDSNPRLSVDWYEGTNLLPSNESILRIHNPKHRRTFSCAVRHPLFGPFNHSFLLLQQGPPEMFNEQKEVSVAVDETVVLHCLVSRLFPLRDLFWSRRSTSTRLERSEKHALKELPINDDLLDLQLLILEAELADEDEYFCSSRNAFGSSKISLHFRVRSRRNYSKLFFAFLFVFVLISVAFLFFVFVKFLRFFRSSNHNRLAAIEDTSPRDLADFPLSNDKSSSNANEYFLSQHTNNLLDYSSLSSHQPFLYHSSDLSSNKYSTVV